MSSVADEVRPKARVYRGNAECRERTRLFFKELAVPNGLLPLKGIEEFGYEEETGFMWMKLKESITHRFRKIGKLVSYGNEITAVIEKGKLKNLTGCKGKELFLWITIKEMMVDYPTKGKVTFKIPSGLCKTFPSSVFEDTDDEDEEDVDG
ncbi:PREDICTED: uncharacterized protein LOC104815231 [Tarenaya hassleriana]|uniref:uncharacterized protein LOC104815231 n=1 Tax=Tarenaya hassleriana TaxID=28532 RepID=UPI00053C1414|nr:PREDICTED: uncharacterized protein LOC104815231 [Tarenaya hassleriana]